MNGKAKRNLMLSAATMLCLLMPSCAYVKVRIPANEPYLKEDTGEAAEAAAQRMRSQTVSQKASSPAGAMIYIAETQPETEPAIEDGITRAEFVQKLYERGERETFEYESIFPDVESEDEYAESILWAHGEQVAFGFESGYFGPDTPITREQVCTVLWRFAVKEDAYVPDQQASLDAFSDREKVSPFAEEAVMWCLAKGIIAEEDGYINPWGIVLADECERILDTFDQVMSKAE